MNIPEDKDESRAYRDALGRFATGVCVVTARSAEGAPCGMTVNSFTSLSLNPRLVSWSIGLDAYHHTTFTHATELGILILAADEVDVCLRFAGQESGRFDLDDWLWEDGLPRIKGGVAWLRCRRYDSRRVGDHRLLIEQVIDYQCRDAPALAFHCGQFSVLPASGPGAGS